MPMLKTTTNEAKLVNMSGTAPATEPTVWRRYTGRQCVVQRCMTEQTYRVTTDELDVLTCNCSIREDWIDEWRFQDGRPVIFRPCPTAGRSPAVVPRQPALSAGLSALVFVPSSNAVRIDYFAGVRRRLCDGRLQPDSERRRRNSTASTERVRNLSSLTKTVAATIKRCINTRLCLSVQCDCLCSWALEVLLLTYLLTTPRRQLHGSVITFSDM